jgi:hypothetical protein
VHFFTTKGEWSYVEYPDDKQTAGSYLYEPGGSIHQFKVAKDAAQDAEGFMVVNGANVNFTEEGEFLDVTDALSIEQAMHQISEAMQKTPPVYIKPKSGAGFSS